MLDYIEMLGGYIEMLGGYIEMPSQNNELATTLG